MMKQTNITPALRPLCALLITLLASPAALAQTPPALPTDAGKILQQEQPAAPTPPALQSEKPLTLPADTPATGTAAEAAGPAFTVQRIVLHGASAQHNAALQALVAPMQGQTTTLAGLRELANQITNWYRTQGYALARAWLPAQTLSQGQVRIEILEGQLSGYTVAGSSRAAAAITTLAQALPTNQPLRQDQLEHTLLLIGEQPGLAGSTFTLSPGQEVGQAQLTINPPPATSPNAAPLMGRIYADNHGGYYSGEYRLGLQGTWSNPTGRGDALDLALNGSNGKTITGKIGYHTLLASNGLRGGISAASTRYELGKNYKALDAYGQAHSIGANLSWPLLRSFNHSINLTADAEHRWLADHIKAFDISNRKQASVLQLALTGQHRDNSGISSWSAAWSGGKLSLKSADNAAIDQASAKTAGYYNKVNLHLQRDQQLWGKNQLRIWGKGQWASKNLDSSEKFSLGGVNGVRAYPQGEAYGDEGWLVRADWRYAVMDNWNIGAGYDTGGVKTNRKPWLQDKNSEHRRGYALFAEGTIGPVDLQATVAWRDGSKAQSAADRSPRFWVQAGWKF